MFALMLAAAVTTAGPVSYDRMCQPHEEIASYIRELKPSVTEKRAMQLARMVSRWSEYYEVSADLMVAIIRQESNFQSVKQCWPAPWLGPDAETCDHGLAQINQVWIDEWQLDAERLVSDDSYNIATQARLLAWLRRYYAEADDEWFGRYHSGTPKRKAAYVAKLGTFLAVR